MKFLCCSLASPGFLYPCIAIAEELRCRGHEVAFVTDSGASEELCNAGFERIPRGPTDGGSFWVHQWGEPLAILIQVKHIEYAMARFCPDALIGQHLTLGPLLVKERHGVPVALIGSATYLWPPNVENCEQPKSDSDRRKAWRFNTMVEAYNEARKLLNLNGSSATKGGNPLLGDLFMIRSVPELELNLIHMPDQVRLIGACLWEPTRPHEELQEWLNNVELGIPIIYVHQGRFFHFPHFWPELMRVACELGVHVAATTGTMDCDVGQVPPDSFIRPHMPQGQILRRASAAVLSANATATLGALTAGVPALMIPAGGEQPDIAELCASAGSARLLHPDAVTTERLGFELRSVLTDPHIKTAAKHLAAAFSRVNSANLAADLLEHVVSRKPQIFPSCDLPLQAGLAV